MTIPPEALAKAETVAGEIAKAEESANPDEDALSRSDFCKPFFVLE